MNIEDKLKYIEDITCFICGKKYIDSTDYLYPLKTGNIYHTSWKLYKEDWICRVCDRKIKLILNDKDNST